MPSPIEDLIALQEVDSAIQRESAEIEAVPRLLEEADARVRSLEEKLEQEKGQLDTAQKQRRKLEGELDSAKERFSKYQDQLMEVKSNEAYRAMLKEIDAVKEDIARHEERILEFMLQADDLEKDVAVKEKEFAAARVEIEREKKDLEARGAEAEKRRADLQARRVDLQSGVPAENLAQYENVAQMRAGLAVIETRDELCLGCRVKVRPQVYQEILNGTELRQCDSCGRFLYVRPETASDPAGASAGKPSPPSQPEKDASRKDEPTA